MIWDTLFSIASGFAGLAWIWLIVLPRWNWAVFAVRYCLIGLFCLAYATLILVFFFRVEGGGFNSIAQVRALFSSDPVLVAGWLHYLAFDLVIGLWIVQRLEASAVSRLLQAPILAATFLFGPFGLLIAYVLLAASARLPPVDL